MSDSPFELLVPDDPSPARREALAGRTLPPTLSSLHESASYYKPAPDLVDAINVALAVGAPLLLTGEPGTGKTQVAYYLAWYFQAGRPVGEPATGYEPFSLDVRSNTTAEDLLYSFDAVAYLHAPNDPVRQGAPIGKDSFIDKGPMWRAYEHDGPAVVLIDEIDKASRDFPNDLLRVLAEARFVVKELRDAEGQPKTIMPQSGKPPVVVITSNSERRLPEPFLRRCIVHHIRFSESLVRRAVEARAAGEFPNLDSRTLDIAIGKFLALRDEELRKPPATAELLTWLAILSAQGASAADVDQPLGELPALVALIKDRDDHDVLRPQDAE